MKKKKEADYKTSAWRLSKPYLIDKKDGRYPLFSKQIKKRGFCNSELWCLYSVIASFVLPRLKEFRRLRHKGHPSCFKSQQEWDAVLDEMIFAFEFSLNEDLSFGFDKNNQRRYSKGMQLFCKHFESLWC
jgi:hypothetical protein